MIEAAVPFVAAPLTFNGMLQASGLDLEKVLIFRHRPYEASLNRVFNQIVGERPNLFDCYQSNHAPRTESALKRASYVASFIRHDAGTALFVGLYKVAGSRVITRDESVNRPAHRELMTYGMEGTISANGRDNVVEFDLPLTEWHSKWRGRLIIKWPGLERSWYRWADRNEFQVEAITRETLLRAPMPEWNEIALEWRELDLLPASWQAALSQWRGVYLIIDQSDGLLYVGSAYGVQNLLQRWSEYARTGHGGNRLLRDRNPINFRFSILQRVSPDLDHASVISLEKSWKERLRSREPFGLNDN